MIMIIVVSVHTDSNKKTKQTKNNITHVINKLLI